LTTFNFIAVLVIAAGCASDHSRELIAVLATDLFTKVEPYRFKSSKKNIKQGDCQVGAVGIVD
jgi:hypothetical protein